MTATSTRAASAVSCGLLALALCACATPATGVVRLNDGLLRAASEREAETFCRTTGEPTRFIEQPPASVGVLFRCD